MNLDENNLNTNRADDIFRHSSFAPSPEGKRREAVIMGIVNITPDSFYPGSRVTNESAIAQRAVEMVEQGASVLDVGGYSTRPGADEVTPDQEWERLRSALGVIRRELPSTVISIDTFRAEVARRCIDAFGVEMINDVSGGELDPSMFDLVVRTRVWYVLMHSKGTPQTMQGLTRYDRLTDEIVEWLRLRVERLQQMGGQRIVIDPGFGFAKTLEQNYQLMDRLEQFHTLGCSLLVGISRKSMIYRLLDITPQESLNGTTVLNTLALLKGAHILRVHDVKEAAQAARICSQLNGCGI